MKLFTKRNILILAILFLLVTNIATISTIIFHKQKNYRHKRFANKKERKEFIRFFYKKKLGLSEKQDNIIQPLRGVHKKKLFKIKDSIHKIKKRFVEEISKTNIDTITLLDISEKYGKLQSKLNMQYTYYYFDLRKECDKKQKKLLFDIYSKRFLFKSKRYKRMKK